MHKKNNKNEMLEAFDGINITWLETSYRQMVFLPSPILFVDFYFVWLLLSKHWYLTS
jgi:hypothetical protein